MNQCAVIPQCKKEGKNLFEIYSETLGKTIIITLCDEHLAMYKKAGVNPKFKDHPIIKWETVMENSQTLTKIEAPAEEGKEKEIKIKRK